MSFPTALLRAGFPAAGSSRTASPLVFHDSIFGDLVLRVPLGGCVLALGDEVLGTLLGSCVTACIRDRHSGIGGMNHFLMPTPSGNSPLPPLLSHGELPFAEAALAGLIDAILEQGGDRRGLEVKLFGGADMLPALASVGQRNVEAALAFLTGQGLSPLACDVGGVESRRVYFQPSTGKVWVRRQGVPASSGQPANRRSPALTSP